MKKKGKSAKRNPSTIVARASQLATLAARICPGLCQQRPADAIAVAKRLLTASEDAIKTEIDHAVLRQLTEEWDAKHGDDRSSPFHKGYDKGVKIITGVQRWSRALEQFKSFLLSEEDTAKRRDQRLGNYRQNGFTPEEVMRLQSAFAEWKTKDKSQKAKASGASRNRKK